MEQKERRRGSGVGERKKERGERARVELRGREYFSLFTQGLKVFFLSGDGSKMPELTPSHPSPALGSGSVIPDLQVGENICMGLHVDRRRREWDEECVGCL